VARNIAETYQSGSAHGVEDRSGDDAVTRETNLNPYRHSLIGNVDKKCQRVDQGDSWRTCAESIHVETWTKLALNVTIHSFNQRCAA
jgi:hypothetical protein